MNTSNSQGISSTTTVHSHRIEKGVFKTYNSVTEATNSSSSVDDSPKHKVYIDAGTSSIRVAHNQREIVENKMRRDFQKALE